MPLLKVDAFGNFYEYGGFGAKPARMTHEDGNVAVGEYGKREARNRELAKRKAKLEHQHAILLMKAKKKVATEKRMAQINAEKNRRAALRKQAIKRQQVKSAQFMRDLNHTKRTVNHGEHLSSSHKTPAQYISKKDMGKRPVPGVKSAKQFGNTTLKVKANRGGSFRRNMNWPPKSRWVRETAFGSIDHPLAAMNGAMYGESPMGFKIKIKRPKIKIKAPSLKKIVPKAVQKVVKKAVKEVGKGAAVVYKAPLQLTHKVVTTVPGVKDVYKGVDKLTGGTLTSLHRTAMLPGKALAGKPISKAEFMEGVINVVKVGAIVVSGGSAVALIGAASSALKNGPLGKTSFGRTVLSVGEIAGLAYGAGQGLASTLSKKATDVVAEKAATEVGKKAGPLGAIAASAAVSAGASGFQGGGPKVPGDKIPAAATATGAKQAAAVAEKAGQEAAKKMAESGIKFSTQAATEEAKKQVVAQAKAHVAQEFKKRTGIPLDIATQVAQGKVPTVAQLKEKLLTDLRNAPDHLKSELAKIADQAKNADVISQKILAEKKKILEKEIVQREKDIARVQEMGAKELVAHNLKFKERGELYMKKVDDLKNVSELARAKREEAERSMQNLGDRDKLLAEAQRLEAQVLAEKQKLQPLEDEVYQLAQQSQIIEQDNAARLAIAEHGGQTKFTKGTQISSASDIRHPMLIFGYV